MLFRKNVLALLLAIFLTVSANAQVVTIPRGATTGAALGSSIGSGLTNVISAMREGRVQAAEFNRELRDARRDFASSKVGSAEEADALMKLTRLLNTIDIYEFTTERARVFAGYTERQVETLTKLAYGEAGLGGGLAPGTELAFDVWQRAMLKHMSGGDGRLDIGDVSADKEKAAFIATEPLYLRYVQLRNWHEYLRAGKAQEYFASSDEYLDFLIKWFPNDSMAGYGGVTDEYAAETREKLFSVFGKKRVLAAAEKLRKQPQSFALRLEKPAALDLLTYESMPPRSLTGLLRDDSDLNGYGILSMGAEQSLVFVDDAQLRLGGWREQHGLAKTDSLLSDIRKLPLDKNGRLVAPPYEGMTVYKALISALPLNPDPVAVRRAEERKQKEEAQAARRAEEQAESRARAKEAAGRQWTKPLAR